MICSVCKKSEATVHLTQIIENKMQTIDLCESCSKAKGVDDPTGFSLAAILLGLGASQDLAKPGASEEIKCSQCGFSLADFKKAGRLGCAECYVAFADALQAPLKSMHKGTRHVGKAPQTQQPILDYSEKLRSLQKKLEQAVAKESFEQAAVLRDEIKKVKELMAPATG
jgi:protein arginine kinase activator